MKVKTAESAESKDWYRDRYQYVVAQRRILVAVAALCAAGALFMALVVQQMIPLKSIEPYVIQIDQRSGITQTVDPLTATDLTANEAMNNYFIVNYVRARESYSPADVTYNYNLIRLMSEDRKIYPKFKEEADPNTATSNIARFGATGTRKVRIKSIAYIGPQLAQVRLLVSERTERTMDNVDLNRIALVGFEYTKMNLSAEERYLNPLGFRVTEYQISEDTLQ